MLAGFAYRTTLEWPVFIVAFMATLLLAVTTVSTIAVRAGLANPIKAIREV